jgi:hypothetical protein
MSEEPTKLTALMSDVEDARPHVLVAVHDIEHARGRPASIISSARRTGTDGIALGGLEDEGVAAAMAAPNIHIGIIAGKLNGVMPAHHAERLARE